MGEYVTVRRINLEARYNEIAMFLQGELRVSKFFSHPDTLPHQATFIADNELWVVTPFTAYGSAKDLIHSWRAWMNWQLLTVCRGCSGSTTPTTWDACTGESKPATYILILHSNSARSVTGSSSTVLSQVLNQGSALAQLVSPLAESSGLWWQIWHCSVRITACEVADGHVSFKDMPAT